MILLTWRNFSKQKPILSTGEHGLDKEIDPCNDVVCDEESKFIYDKLLELCKSGLRNPAKYEMNCNIVSSREEIAYSTWTAGSY